ncbi:hypothetical protein SNE40_022267 [Patella caerulea]|uniref:G-protein coupled receptors family 3 profile domain-containing protein n=1 Tax=Patella caerulea TaxID=87958 RepID=A0AAN8IXF3_PATCE
MEIGSAAIRRLVFLVLVVGYARGGFYVPDLPTKRYIKEGDINLGAIFPIGSFSRVKPCGVGLRSTVVLQFIEALVYAVDVINNSSDILPNTTLGFVILDDCLKETTTIAQSLSFIPEVNVCQSTCSANASLSQATPRYDVVGVVGSLKSSNSIAAASLLGPVHIPQISYSSTSDQLSNKVLYPYFMRVVPPDEFQAEAIVSLISQYGWSYISIVYSEGSYGEYGYKNIKKLTDKGGICIGTTNKIAEGALPNDYLKVAQDLLNHSNAKVVVVFAGPSQTKGLFTALKSLGKGTKFIFIGSDGWAKRIKNLGEVWEVGLGAFGVSFYSEEDPLYTEYFKSIRPTLNEQDPWFREFWEGHFSCTFDNSSASPCDENAMLSAANGFKPVPTVTPVMDATSTFALALHNLLADNCPGVDGSNVRSCITGPLLLDYLKNTTFNGRNGVIKFDANGNQLGRYMIHQLVRGNPYTQIKVATYDALTKKIKMSNNVTWEYVNQYSSESPESICSKPCGPREFYIQMELMCCWECKACRSNEIVSIEGTSCVSCPHFHWPEPNTNFTTCSAISPASMTWEQPLAIILMTLSSIGITATLVICAYYFKNNDAKCIKASSRELSYMMLIGVFIGYAIVFALMAKPNHFMCKTNFFFFCLSFTWIYAPLLARTCRIYRIFESGKKSNKRLVLISARSQLFLSFILIFGQLIISTCILILSTPEARLTMPVSSHKYVELSCDLTLPGVASFLSYNIVLVVICSVLAFKTRKLPDNFNESRFISTCVYTTLIIWLAFVSTYFTAGREYLKTVSLSFALILNGTVVLLFLFAPKIYATVCLNDGDCINTKSGRSTKNTGLSADGDASTTNGSASFCGGANFNKVHPINLGLPSSVSNA